EMRTFSGRTIDVPSVFIAGKSDWGVYQTPGAAETMQTTACTRMVGFHLVDGAGKVAGFSGSCSGRASAGVTPSSSRRAIRPWAGSRAPTAGAAAHRSDRRRDGGAQESETSPPFRRRSLDSSGARDGIRPELPCAALT